MPLQRLARLTFGLILLSFALESRGQDNKDNRPGAACLESSPQAINFFETRAVDRTEEDLSLVDGININRDVLVVVCRKPLMDRFGAQITATGSIVVEVRAWQKPKESGWREMRLNEPSAEQAADLLATGYSPDLWDVEQVNLVIGPNTAVDPITTIPLRRDAVKTEDLIRIRVRIRPGLPNRGSASPAAAGGAPPEKTVRGPIFSENEEVIDSIFEVGRFGLHVGFSDAIVFVQRLGEDRANSLQTNAVVFDSVNFRPAPGISYGFNFYDRRRAFLRFLEPGFGANLTFLNWNERDRSAGVSDVTTVTALQIGVGAMGSMFDGTVVAVLGWNLHVKDYRPYFGIGFSITGLVRKMSQFLK